VGIAQETLLHLQQKLEAKNMFLITVSYLECVELLGAQPSSSKTWSLIMLNGDLIGKH
jgi:hypothetical protein